MDTIDRKIKTSLKSIIYYCESPNKIDSATNFIGLINTTKEVVSNSEAIPAIKDRVAQIPNFELSEIAEQISASEREMSPSWFEIIFSFIRIVKLNKEPIHDIHNKFETTKSLCHSVIHIINHPGFEELLGNKES